MPCSLPARCSLREFLPGCRLMEGWSDNLIKNIGGYKSRKISISVSHFQLVFDAIRISQGHSFCPRKIGMCEKFQCINLEIFDISKFEN